MTLFRETIDLAKEIMPGDLWAFHFNYANTLVQSGKTMLVKCCYTGRILFDDLIILIMSSYHVNLRTCDLFINLNF